MKAFRALYLANALEFLRDRLAVLITLAMPLLFAVVFGLLFSSAGDGVTINLGLVVDDQGPAAQQLITMLGGRELSGVLNVTQGDLDSSLESLRKGDLDAVLVLPADLSAKVGSAEPLVLPTYYDPERQKSAGTAMGVLQSLTAQANLVLAGAPALLSVEARSVKGEQVSMAGFYVPSMLGLAMLWLGVFGTAQPVVQMREQQVLRRLGVTPLPRRTIMAAQVGWRVTVGLTQAVLFVILGYFAFGLGLSGGIVPFALISILGAVAFVTLGYFLAAVSPTLDSAVAIAQVVNFAMTFFSGSFFQPEFLPPFLRPLLYAMPLTYLGDALRQVMSGWHPLMPLWLDALVLAGMVVVLGPLTIRFWRWE